LAQATEQRAQTYKAKGRSALSLCGSSLTAELTSCVRVCSIRYL